MLDKKKEISCSLFYLLDKKKEILLALYFTCLIKKKEILLARYDRLENVFCEIGESEREKQRDKVFCEIGESERERQRWRKKASEIDSVPISQKKENIVQTIVLSN